MPRQAAGQDGTTDANDEPPAEGGELSQTHYASTNAEDGMTDLDTAAARTSDDSGRESLMQDSLGRHEHEEGSGAASRPSENDVDGSSADTAARSMPAPPPAPRREVLIRGQPVDITDTGIDPEFLEALPEDMREEVVNQHFRERRSNTTASLIGATGANGLRSYTTGAGSFDVNVHQELARLNSEFLEALPDDIRRELLQAEELEIRRRAQAEESQRRRARIAAGETAGSESDVGQPLEMDPATFLATLDPALRESVLMEQGDDFIASLPPSIMAEANALRDQYRMRHRAAHSMSALADGSSGGSQNRTRGNHGTGVNGSSKSYVPRRDTIQLLDKSSLSVLVRLLYFPTIASLTLLRRVLVNLCENSKTRADLISLLISMVQDGSENESKLSSSFTHMTNRAAKCLSGSGINPQTPRGPGHRASTSVGQLDSGMLPIKGIGGESLPHIVLLRSFETLNNLVVANDLAAIHFLTEQEGGPVARRSAVKRSRNKERERGKQPYYPLVALLALLDRPIILKSSSAMDALTLLISNITKVLTYHHKQKRLAEDSRSPKVDVQDTPQTTATRGDVARARSANSDLQSSLYSASGSASTANPAADVTMQTVPIAVTAEDPNGIVPSSGQMHPMDVEQVTRRITSVQEANPPGSEGTMQVDDTEAPKETLQTCSEDLGFAGLNNIPAISTESLVLLVNALIYGSCSSKTFQHTLSAMQNVLLIKGAHEAMCNELRDRAQEAAKETEAELLELENSLKKGSALEHVQLTNFSPATSNQAKLLRLLKTLDYLYSRHGANGSGRVTDELGAQSSSGPSSGIQGTENDPDPFKVDTLDGKKATISAAVKASEVRDLFAKFQALTVWMTLNRVLVAVEARDELQYIPTVLLPIIEAFLVICQFVDLFSPSLSAGSGSMSPRPLLPIRDPAQDIFFKFTEDNRKILNALVRTNPSLMSGSFSLLVRNPKALDFDNKRNYFYQQLHKSRSRDHQGPLHINVRRQYVFEDSYHNLQRRTGDEVRNGKLVVKFYDEEGVDAGGVTREWFSVLAKQMFNPDYALFAPCAADRWTYQPNRASKINDEHLNFFRFVGRIIGKAIHDNRLLDCYFTRSFYKHILSKPVDYRDIESVDPEYYKSLVWILENDPGVLELNFTLEDDEFGQTKVIELRPDGYRTLVTQENKFEYVRLVTEQKLTRSIQDQIKAFLEGFCQIVPADLIRIFTEQELELLISGVPEINIEDWKANTEYHNFTVQNPTVQWFWRAIRSMSQEEMASVLQFVTGTSKVPLGGFAKLEGVNGVQRFQIHKDFAGTDRLPQAHTCFNQLDLPNYPDYETLRARLHTAISEGAQGFGFA